MLKNLHALVIIAFTGGLTLSLNNAHSQNYIGGASAGASITTGANNVLLGPNSGILTNTGNHNSFVGSSAGFNNTGGQYNTYFGSNTGYMNVTGTGNALFGYFAGFYNTASENTYIGYNAGFQATTGNQNVFLGNTAGYANVTGARLTLLGSAAGYSNKGSDNTFVGQSAGFNNTTAGSNTFFGSSAGYHNTTGNNNLLAGYSTGFDITTGSGNVVLGSQSGKTWTGKNYNTIIGYNTGNKSTLGNGNVIFGSYAGSDYNFSIDTSVFMVNNQYASKNALLFGRFARNSNPGSAAGTISYKAQLAVNTSYVEPGMTLTVNGATYIGNFEPAGFNSGFVPDSTLAGYYLWVEKGVVSEDFAIAKVQDWSDYVFKKEYALTPLAEVEQYIQQHAHLPGIPSEVQIKKTGYTVHDMSKRFMAKIEELTLYAIDQQKKIAAQQQQIETLTDAVNQVQALQKEMAQLKALLDTNKK